MWPWLLFYSDGYSWVRQLITFSNDRPERDTLIKPEFHYVLTDKLLSAPPVLVDCEAAASPLVSLRCRSNYSDTLRWSGQTWPLTLDPDPRPSDGPKHMRTGWDMRRRWTTPTPPPTNSRRPVLTCPSWRGERLACANVWRISFRRGESYEWRCVFTVRKRGKRQRRLNHPDQTVTVALVQHIRKHRNRKSNTAYKDFTLLQLILTGS